ncbi:MAG: DUF4350 domain-containing protein [Microcystaceae cyanobacterium]
MKISQRKLYLYGAIAIGVIILMTFLLAPTNNKLNSGSTYSRSPDGYGAWYAFMSARGTPIQRWQKPFQNLINSQNIKPPITVLKIAGALTTGELDSSTHDWIEKGNILVVLGIRQPVTEAAFSTLQNSSVGKVKIKTTRRAKNRNKLLGDSFGAVVWQEEIGRGKVIFVTTPYLAANAYQDQLGNYEFLAQLITQFNPEKNTSIQNKVWVDEYIHGYKDAEVIKREIGGNLFSYLVHKPIFIVLIQVLIVLLVAIWAGNRRFGVPTPLSTPVVNNSEAYIQALASVLQKAEKSEFVLEIIGQEEQQQLQRALGLGDVLLEHQPLVEAWIQQTGCSAAELQPLLQAQSRHRSINEAELLIWLGKWEQIRKIGNG